MRQKLINKSGVLVDDVAPERVHIAEAESLEDAVPEVVDRVEVHFYAFNDGRGFSLARGLRERGFAGELVATGEVLADQALMLFQCGFDLLRLREGEDVSVVERALARRRRTPSGLTL